MSTTILHIDSSAHDKGSVTRQLSADTVAQLKQTYPDAKVIYRDLMRNPLPHANADFIKAISGGPLEGAAAEDHKQSEALIAELLSADILVIGAPMYNFTVPTQLKAWIDYVVIAGKTFKYTATGLQGLVTGKRAFIVSATGGVYSSGPMATYDHVVPYLKQVLGFIGITDVQAIIAEKQGMGPESAAESLAAARKELGEKLKKAS